MSLQPDLRKRIVKVLSTLDDQGSLGPRLTGDAARLWKRIAKFVAMNLIGPPVEEDCAGTGVLCAAASAAAGKGRDRRAAGV